MIDMDVAKEFVKGNFTLMANMKIGKLFIAEGLNGLMGQLQF